MGWRLNAMPISLNVTRAAGDVMCANSTGYVDYLKFSKIKSPRRNVKIDEGDAGV